MYLHEVIISQKEDGEQLRTPNVALWPPQASMCAYIPHTHKKQNVKMQRKVEQKN